MLLSDCMIDTLLGQLASQGILGIFLVLVFVGYYRKDEKVSELQEKRLDDMRAVKDQYAKLLTEVNSTIDRLVVVVKAKRGGKNDS